MAAVMPTTSQPLSGPPEIADRRDDSRLICASLGRADGWLWFAFSACTLASSGALPCCAAPRSLRPLRFFEPVKSLLHQSLRAGRIPLWAPQLFCGYPIAAEGRSRPTPPSPGCLLAASSWAAVNWLIILHLMLAAVGM